MAIDACWRLSRRLDVAGWRADMSVVEQVQNRHEVGTPL
jgi:hypothetical protein